MNSDSIIADAVTKYWRETSLYPCDVVAFFYQKYDFESKWERCRELCSPHSSDNYSTVCFMNDFCEGQACVKEIKIVKLDDILDFYEQEVQ